MKKSKILVMFIVTVCLIISVLGCATASQPATESAVSQPQSTPAEVIQLKASHAYPSGQYQMNVIHEYWKESVEKNTNGRVKVTIYPAAQLFSAKDELSALSLGSIDFSTTPNVYLSSSYPALRFMEFPFLFQDMDHYYRFFDAAKEKLAKIYSQKGVKYLGETGYPSYGVWNTKLPLTTMDDFKGLKLRAGGIQKMAVESWGASGVMIESAELPTSLQQGMVDGTISTPTMVADVPLYPYLKYGSSYKKYMFYASVPQLMSLKTWNSLPADIQKIIETTVASDVLASSIKLDDEVTGDRYKKIEGAGVKLSWFSDSEIEKMNTAFKPILEKQLAGYGADAAELYDMVIKTRK